MVLSRHSHDKKLLKQKIQNIKASIQQLIPLFCSEKFDITWYGAYDIDPKYLVYWICVQTDQTKHEMQNNIQLNKELRQLLEEYEYPIEAQKFVSIGFESQETVNRESNGNWWYHFK